MPGCFMGQTSMLVFDTEQEQTSVAIEQLVAPLVSVGVTKLLCCGLQN